MKKSLVSEDHSSSESFVFLQPDGERSIIMASGSTSIIDGHVARKYFGIYFFLIFTTSNVFIGDEKASKCHDMS